MYIKIFLILSLFYLNSGFKIVHPIYDCSNTKQIIAEIPPYPDCSEIKSSLLSKTKIQKINITVWNLNEETLYHTVTECTKVEHISEHHTYLFYANNCNDKFINLPVTIDECTSHTSIEKRPFSCSSFASDFSTSRIIYNNSTKTIFYTKTTGLFNYQGTKCNVYNSSVCIGLKGILFYDSIKVDLCIASEKYSDECTINEYIDHVELICFKIGSRFIIRKNAESFILNPEGCNHELKSSIQVLKSNEGSLISFINSNGHHITDLTKTIISNRYPHINKLSEINSKIGLITGEITQALTNISDVAQINNCENKKVQWNFAKSIIKSNEILAVQLFLHKDNIIGYINEDLIYYKTCKSIKTYTILNDKDFDHVQVRINDDYEVWVNPNTSFIISDPHVIRKNQKKHKIFIKPVRKINKYTLSNIEHLNSIEFDSKLDNDDVQYVQGDQHDNENKGSIGTNQKWSFPSVTSSYFLDIIIYFVLVFLFILFLQFFLCACNKFKFSRLPSDNLQLP